ncbi:yippee zinc-binding/DNA-binding /Mis18, centromere assembly-domain-containing protein [Pseudoneurospora amorphoporcata]|uniref:Yippee zinc-binding/DNA-binding /Mis18, centromere assembly-domain-containing protein n=1 Tax=Pseudoneurospora amorphoporcata TaxID=241081 RepID=A0AAN6SIW8_9PEZI|nr:yippee zinc-binding/DNA-binding /Mis18, centromere assembly-domain-containing protein [Pseudoneurospora amorphoporcata]
MIESEQRRFGRSFERILPEPEVHHQHQQPQEQNAQVEDVQQQVQRLGISDNNADESNRARAAAPEPESVPASTSAEEDAGVIRVSVTTTTTVSEATPIAPSSSYRRNIITTATRNNNTTNDTTNANNNTNTMGLAYNVYLNSGKIYGCRNCKTHLANHEDIISRNFRGQHGKAYLFNSVVNVETGDAGERNMTTGRHVVRDIYCRQCKEVVGWKYDKAYEPSEKYKEGKFILEAELLANVN